MYLGPRLSGGTQLFVKALTGKTIALDMMRLRLRGILQIFVESLIDMTITMDVEALDAIDNVRPKRTKKACLSIRSDRSLLAAVGRWSHAIRV